MYTVWPFFKVLIKVELSMPIYIRNTIEPEHYKTSICKFTAENILRKSFQEKKMEIYMNDYLFKWYGAKKRDSRKLL